jgi:hypothetical protein
VAGAFQITKFEFTNQQYTDFLNLVAATDNCSLYNSSMGSNARCGITRSCVSGSYTYTVRTTMGDKPVNFVSWLRQHERRLLELRDAERHSPCAPQLGPCGGSAIGWAIR